MPRSPRRSTEPSSRSTPPRATRPRRRRARRDRADQRRRTGGRPRPPRTRRPSPRPPSEVVDIVMPAMGESVSEGVVLEWAKQVGEAIDADETIVEISTDKVDAEVPAPASGTVTEILAAGRRDRDRRPGHRPHDRRRRRRAPRTRPRPSRRARPVPAGVEPVDVADGSRITPVAKRVAAAHGIDLAGVHGSGPAGRIGKDDVLAAVNGGAPTAPPAAAPQQARRRDAHQGRLGDARALHGRVARRPDRDLVPHDHGHRRSTRAASSSRRPATASPSPI